MIGAEVKNISKWLLHVFLCALYLCLTCTVADFISTPVKESSDVIIAVMHWSTVLIAVFSSLLIISLLPKWLFSIFYSLTACISAMLAYFRHTIGFSFNTMILDIVFDNDVAVSADMVTWPLILWMLIITSGALWLSLQKKRYTLDLKDKYIYIPVVLALISAFIMYNPDGRFSRPVRERIPINIFYITGKYLVDKNEVMTVRPCVCDYAVSLNPEDSIVTVVVIGEALRRDNLSINGYYRNTTPKLAELNVVSFDSLYSEYVYTNRSVPHILTRADKDNPDRAYTERSFIDIFKKAGIRTASIANQDFEKSYNYFINEADTVIISNISKNFYNFDKWLDGDVLPHYNNLLAQSDNQMILIHTIGSHWWYNAHYTDEYEVFKPVMKSRIVSNCDSMEIVNSYDNTVLYTDYVLSEIIMPLQEKCAVVIYVSDHGEALGENNMWLHAGDSEMMHYPAAFVWMSDVYKQKFPYKNDAVENNRHKNITTDAVYHSVIDAADINTDVLDTTLSVFRN